MNKLSRWIEIKAGEDKVPYNIQYAIQNWCFFISAMIGFLAMLGAFTPHFYLNVALGVACGLLSPLSYLTIIGILSRTCYKENKV